MGRFRFLTAGESHGPALGVTIEGVPAGLGAPVYAKLDGDLAGALMGINAVKGVEIGAGFGAAELSGEENADEMRMGNQGVSFLSNHAGGILGGISTGQPVVARFAVKPTSSILSPRRTVDRKGADTDIMTKGRHDPCVGIRAVPVGEAMLACVLAAAMVPGISPTVQLPTNTWDLAIGLGGELFFLEFGIGGHSTVAIAARQLEHAVVERVESSESDKLKFVTHRAKLALEFRDR